MDSTKSDVKSESFRIAGNECYSKRKFFDALVNYNRSLCLATSESENLGLAYANRSAVYFELKFYDKCLKNIELARRHRYPQKNAEILAKREQKCREMLKQQTRLTNPWDFFKLSYKPHKNLPFAAECLELRTNEKYGRHIVTNKDLCVGDVVVIEKPFINVLLSHSVFHEVDASNKFQRCAGCLRDCQMDLLPCEGCCEGDDVF